MKKNFENELKTVIGKEGFTLAETLITVAILGVVAAITIPAIINHQTESANRTKLKKAMTTYEKALNQMIIENDLKTNDAITAFGADGGNCTNTTEYFKKVEGSGCRFKTADRIWWDITDIENPVISLKDEITEDNATTMKENAKSLDSDRTSFAMIGRLDDTTGVLRINDKGAETETPNKEYMTKLYNFSNNQKGETSCGPYCQASKITTECIDEKKNCYENNDGYNYYYDENGVNIMIKTVDNVGFPSGVILKNGYKAYITFGLCDDINDLTTCLGLCGSIEDKEGNSTYYGYALDECYSVNNGENGRYCPITKDEIKASFM